MDKRKYTLLWLLPLMAMTLAFILSFEGCTPKPTEAPTTTVITGTGQRTLLPNSMETYTFSSGGMNYGKFYLKRYSSSLYFEAWGIVLDETNSMTAPAPDSIYYDNKTSPIELSKRYFIQTDEKIHYCKITVTRVHENFEAPFDITVSFNWVLQTEANNRNLY
jgi:hypothetical protein